MKYAYIENGIVQQVVQNDPANLFSPTHAAKFVPVANEVEGGWTHADGVFAPPPPPPPPTPEQVRDAAKAQRTAQVEQIKVTTTAGNTFDGDETSQTRMSRAIIALSTGLAPSVNWVLADNSVIQATAAELTEALVLAGQAQAAIWIL